jgi:hypothetical protein
MLWLGDGGTAMAALRIRDDISSSELRRQARRENDGRVSARLIALANALDGMDRASAARLAGMDRQTVARLGAPLQRRRHRRAVGSAEAGAHAQAERRPDGQPESDCAGGSRSSNRADRALAGCRSVPLCRGALGRQLQRDWDAAPVVVARPEPPQDPAAPPAERREGAASLQKGGFAACLNEIAAAHPEAERFEIWSQDEARVGQKGRTGYVWWQRGHTPRGRRDIGYQSAWIIGAVCPARDTGVALVLTRLDTAAMNLFLAELSRAVAPGAQ